MVVVVNRINLKSAQGGSFEKLAVLTKDTKAVAARVSASGGAKKGSNGGDVLFAGEVPGIGTKVKSPVPPGTAVAAKLS